MLTPAEELGLGGLGLDSRVRQSIFALGSGRTLELMERMREEATRRHLTYLRGGVPETIHVFLRPVAVMPDQMAYLHFVSLTILNAVKRLPDLYLADEAIRRLLPLTEAEESWLRDSWGPSQRDINPVLGRLDAMVEFTSPMWKDSLRFVEPNLCGVGGLHLGPTCEGLLADIMIPVLSELDPALSLEVGSDSRELFIQEIIEHLEAIGRQGETICFIEPKYAGDGPDEQAALADYFHERHGLTILHADPSELALVDGEVTYEGRVIDMAYRDYEVRDLLALERERQIDIEPIRVLFRQNRIMSSVAGDFDHKSCWEILTDPELTRRHFNADERQVFRRHILWTRMVAERMTLLPDGDVGDLLPFIRKERDRLVLKPNRSYGGEGVLIGHLSSVADWDDALDNALKRPGEWVVQRLAHIPVSEFPVQAADGSVHIEPFYTVMGFLPTKYGLAIFGRASQKQVINVAQRGGMLGVLLGPHPTRLIGPGGTR